MEESEKQPMGKREPRRHDILENKEESIPRKRDLTSNVPSEDKD